MTPASWGAVATSCTPPQAGDRVTYNHYDALSRLDKVTRGYGTSIAAEEVQTFTANGQVKTLRDANGNLTTYEYDGFDRLIGTRFPSPTAVGSSSTTDYELVGKYQNGSFVSGYDANGNITLFTTRRGETLSLSYDNLDRLVTKVVPERIDLSTTHTRDVYFAYDLFGNMTDARFDSTSGQGIANTYDALSRLKKSTVNLDGVSREVAYEYDAAGNRIRLTHPDAQYFEYKRRASGAFNYATAGASAPLFHPELNTSAQLNKLLRWDFSAGAAGDWGNAATFGYDAVARLSGLQTDLAGTIYDNTASFTYNAASQIGTSTRSNDIYVWDRSYNVNRAYTSNGLNQYTAVGSATFAYDGNGNLTSDGTNTYVYDAENRLVSRSGGGATATLRYDPLGRLYEIDGSVSGLRRFLYDGSDLIAEYNASGALIERYVHGLSGGDDPLVWFEGGSTADSARRYLYPDERGSIIAITDGSGNVVNVNSYDEYGIPDNGGNIGRFQYTGQAWLPDLGMYYYKARMYSPTLGRFMQTDTIGYGDGMNMYAYVGDDPLNAADPSGMFEIDGGSEIEVWGRIERYCFVCDMYRDMVREWLRGWSPDEPVHYDGAIVVPGKRPKKKQQPPQSPQEKKLSPCMVGFLNRATSGTDWGAVRFTEGSTWGGRRASTSLNLVTYSDWRHSRDFSLLLHELGHIPDWQSGELTNFSYARESASAWWNDRDTWAGNRFEQNANLFRILVDDAYREAGSPCNGNIFSQ